MDAGGFDIRVSLQSYTSTTDSNTGEKLHTWTTYANVWAKIKEAPTGVEQVNADRRENKQIVDFTIRYNSNVLVKHRVEWNGKYYNIISLQEINRKFYLKIQTELSE
jgi:SPP1 family predicted phage head-tail adaptor